MVTLYASPGLTLVSGVVSGSGTRSKLILTKEFSHGGVRHQA